MEIRGHGGITHFGNSEGRGKLKYGSRPWYGMDIFWNCPLQVTTHFSEIIELKFGKKLPYILCILTLF